VPIPFALLLAFPAGVALAWIARAELSRHEGSMLASRSGWVALAFGAFVLSPQALYFATFHGDWAYLYWVSDKSIPSAVDLSLAIACAGLVVAGHAIAAPLAVARKSPVVLALFATPTFMAAALALLAQNRLAVSATYAQFHGGFGAMSIAEAPLGRAVLLTLTVVVAAAAWSVQLVRPTTRPRAGRARS
jgi:hypothetical protein